MKIEFHYWPGNTEIQLVDDDGSVKDRFYTVEKLIEIVCPDLPGIPPIQAQSLFRVLEANLLPPHIGGAWAEHHPYWQQRKERHGE